MAGAAKKTKRIFTHSLVFQRQSFGIAIAVELMYPLADVWQAVEN